MSRQRPIWDHVDFLSGECWEWTYTKSPDGYGVRKVGGRVRGAHVLMYELLVGPIPPGLELDHLCRNKACVNPAHLEPVTHTENLRRARIWKGNAIDGRRKRFTVNMPESLYNCVKAHAKARGVSLSHYLRDIILEEIKGA